MGKYNRVFADSKEGYDDYYGFNPYYNPEKCGLKLLHVIDVPDLSYEYETIIVVQDKATGAVFMAHDSGCSCPTPFEEFRSLADMTRIKKPEDYDKFMDGYNHKVGGGDGSYGDYSYYFDTGDVRKARRKVVNALKKVES